MKIYTIEDDTVILLGENAQDNLDIIDIANPNWIWLHLKSFPSAHVIIQSTDPTERDILWAAELCKKSTKYKNIRNLKISYCPIKNLKKGSDIGSVSYISNRIVRDIKIK